MLYLRRLRRAIMTASAGMFQGQRWPPFLVFFLLSAHSQAAPCSSCTPAAVGNAPCFAKGDPHFRTLGGIKCVSHTHRLSLASELALG